MTLYVSKGSDKVTLSDYSGISYDNAVSRLIALGIPESQIKRVDEESDKVEKDTVISQEPASGTAVDPKNDTITLHVSKGSDSVTVPDISGYSPKLQKTASITLALKSMNKDYLALAMAKSLNELAHPLAAKSKRRLCYSLLFKSK